MHQRRRVVNRFVFTRFHDGEAHLRRGADQQAERLAGDSWRWVANGIRYWRRQLIDSVVMFRVYTLCVDLLSYPDSTHTQGDILALIIRNKTVFTWRT